MKEYPSFWHKTAPSDLTIATAFEAWMDILTGKADGQQTFLEQKYTAEGDMSPRSSTTPKQTTTYRVF